MTNKYTKAWNDLENDPDIATYETLDKTYKWYLVPGVWIAKYPNGDVEIKTVYGSGDKYREIKHTQERYFEDYGFWAGAYRLNVDYFEDAMLDAKERLEQVLGTDDEDRVREKFEEAEAKMNMYKEKLNKALKSAQV